MHGFSLPAAWPRPADPAAADRLLERFAALGAGPGRLVLKPAPRAMLAALGGGSPYLADLALREPDIVLGFARQGPEPAVAAALASVRAATPAMPRADLARRLRLAKRRLALAAALADIGGIWPLARVTAALSQLAEVALGACVDHLLHHAAELYLPRRSSPSTRCGFTVLGMGKLGAGELNYSSDIDLILLQDPEAGTYRGDAPAQFWARMARDIVSLLEARDAEGYVFRVDLRLRPDPAATPPVVALPAALAYYESMGQNWERAAMLKARPVAGDLALGQHFLDAIRPFVWRRHLDFAAIADIEAMKRRIDVHKGTTLADSADPVERLLGHDVKLGEGGIREIEFLAQTQQLVWGGRAPELRTPRTLEALPALAAAGHVGEDAAAFLARAYQRLRVVEHRLQMVADHQTHSLPRSRDEFAAFATFMGAPSASAFAHDLATLLDGVRSRFTDVFGHASDEAPSLDFTGPEPPPRTIGMLRSMGFAAPEAAAELATGWLAGRPRALRSERSRGLMARLLPSLLEALAEQRSPDAVLQRFDAFLARLPAGVQLLSLFERNPALMRRIAGVLGASPALAEHLARHPAALDGLLAPEPPRALFARMRARLGDAPDLESSIEVVRETVRAQDFFTAVATIEGRLDADAAGEARSTTADAALRALLPVVLADFAARHGRVRGGGMAVVLLGKAGGLEMMAGSDLDLMFIYDHPPASSHSTARGGARELPASQWFIRAVHAFVAAVTAPDAAGPMYAVDMRLRPSGNKGPVAVPAAGFARYHATEAWTWERMALTRARVVAGPARLRARVNAMIGEALRVPDASRVRADAAAMRARLARELPPAGPWDAKHRLGGQMEVEFIAQALSLIHPGAAHPTTRVALAQLRDAGALDAAEAAALIHADHTWRTLMGMLRLAPPDRDTLPAPVLAALGAGDAGELAARLDAMAADVRRIFETRIGPVG
ncbi:MAG: bifunctional [glutamine synthetase] adenylyltransferase/[glutamine synthetase]-adenylyl-L-tyrosine phosphorylase [Rhodospirillales bacterium]|nr:bifunctional [glutamine synthetase] adenylyltransferase/[glutamine synthetase]-adenylyl-L-tyrosine phosphorylase [Rhodospirillales bacterium]